MCAGPAFASPRSSHQFSVVRSSVVFVRVSTIRPDSVTGHYAAGGFIPADVEVINAEVGQFLDVVTQRGARLK